MLGVAVTVIFVPYATEEPLEIVLPEASLSVTVPLVGVVTVILYVIFVNVTETVVS